MEKAIEFEIKRQTAALAEGEKLFQETRGWNEDKGITFSQRIKETSADYRYFPEPDIPPLEFTEDWIETIKSRLIELPPEKAKRFRNEYFFNENDSAILAADKNLAKFTEQVLCELDSWIRTNGDNPERQKHELGKITANWLINELFKHLKSEGITISDLKITPENFAELVCLIHEGKINSSAGQTILAQMFNKGGDPSNILSELGLEQIDNLTELEVIIEGVIEQNPIQTEQYRQGKESLLQYFVGQTMAATKGKANPKIVVEILKKMLKLS
jgi:aspartyl-tRNA(Asn)/glutamyl-tRNA(Gln) amidotransferase subunit B